MKSDAVTSDRILQALNNGEFEPYIQPVVNASDLSVSGGELLVRWHTPAGEIIPPARFIAHVETLGMLSNLTQKMVRQSASRFAGMKMMPLQGFRLTVNVTPMLLADRDFVQMCLALANENGIHLVLELTEQRLFSETDSMMRNLDRLSDVGVEFALDDFGTGHSVLSYLKYFPINYIKIDKIFIQDVLWEKKSMHIVESVVFLAEKLGVNTVAEGVETLEQVTCLQELGIYYFQGYYFGKPQ
ncbi:EAL domain-containing protein, partial [Escherichia coli]|uniref:EAL domain-containing protein n=1 Tax=Escherichia coli TaxID=562 RepID=UPI0038B5147C